MKERIEHDSFGPIKIPEDRLYGPQTQRSLEFFRIGTDRFSPEFIHSFALLKKAAARANEELGLLPPDLATAIAEACDEVASGKWDEHFPLVVWQTGSGTQTHMNVNEVIAHLATKAAGKKVDAHDHVNMSQSSNDAFPTAMHLVCAELVEHSLLPAVQDLRNAFLAKGEDYKAVLKLGRTHMMDAVPMTFGQELSAYAAQLEFAESTIKEAQKGLFPLPLGGTAVGTGLNTHPQFAEKAAQLLKAWTGLPFEIATNRFALIAAHDSLVKLSSSLKLLAVAGIKIGNDLRLLGSGPRGGFGELRLPANEPGSSIMPGKVNPTQIEALTMVCAQVIGNDAAATFAGTQGQLELNTYKPLILNGLLQSLRLLTDVCVSFRVNCVEGMEAEVAVMRQHLDRSLMLVTALNPILGYDKAAELANHAFKKNLTLKQAAEELGMVSPAEFDRMVRPESMLGPSV